MVWSILLSSLAPKAWAIGIPKPAASPKTNPIIKKFNEPVEPTAARAFVPQAWPTIIFLQSLCQRRYKVVGK